MHEILKALEFSYSEKRAGDYESCKIINSEKNFKNKSWFIIGTSNHAVTEFKYRLYRFFGLGFALFKNSVQKRIKKSISIIIFCFTEIIKNHHYRN